MMRLTGGELLESSPKASERLGTQEGCWGALCWPFSLATGGIETFSVPCECISRHWEPCRKQQGGEDTKSPSHTAAAPPQRCKAELLSSQNHETSHFSDPQPTVGVKPLKFTSPAPLLIRQQQMQIQSQPFPSLPMQDVGVTDR